ncbi:RNA polymerase sigma factor [Chengkuizengella axinellae]|uniref:RNA polymerase sigma factor n=1 Tax=Chengkuizengella axinellae TaxID=3064388 RepID=A0ABT9J1E6_9BACL|nr:RNA polymerase sigma factor [Chengkuizengella sp. 2205SS18-9]MDP5275446.1 RNA polymerase sigma factor [Chengkuizengella sp. 2205SS18-9]
MKEVNSLRAFSEKVKKIEGEFKKEIEPFRSALWKYCYKLTGSPWDAEDLVQETLLKSLSMLPKVHQQMNIKSYLFRVATNHWIDQYRKKKMTMNEGYEIDWIQDSSIDPVYHRLENLDFILRVLSPKQFVSLILVDVFLFKASEAAEIIGTNQGAVYANVNRARKLLQEIQQNDHKKEKMKSSSESIIHYNKSMKLLLEGFSKKDPKLIATLLDDHVVTEITHAGIEFGKGETEKNSLKDWHEVVLQQGQIFAEYKMLWGMPVVAEYELKEDGSYLNNIHYIEFEEDKITHWKFYCFSWDLMNAAAKELDVQLNAIYFYHIY